MIRILMVAAHLIAVPVADQDVPHDIPWFADHPAERRAFLDQCRRDYNLAFTADCANAEAGATMAWGRTLKPAEPDVMPEWRLPPPGDPLPPPTVGGPFVTPIPAPAIPATKRRDRAA